MRAEYPGPFSPPLPAVSVDIPDGWTLKPHANALIAAFDPNSPVLGRTTMYVTAGRLVGGTSLDEVVAKGHASLRGRYPDSELELTKHGTAGGHEARFSVITVRGAEFPSPLFQTETSILVPSAVPEVSHVVQLLCQCAATTAKEMSPVFSAILKSLSIS